MNFEESVKIKQAQSRQSLRILKFLNKIGTTKIAISDGQDRIYLSQGEQKFSFCARQFANLLNTGLINKAGSTVTISKTGIANLKRGLFPEHPYLAQQSDLASSSITIRGATQPVLKNENESALLRLFTRKDKQGNAWIDAHQFQAGEKLRSDFEKAQMQPRISANWEANVARKNHGGAGLAELSDFALDARVRLDKAITALGPELSGVTLDICCFLKGLEAVEREKGWPPRSAKLLLKTALSVLARHYGLNQNNIGKKSTFWGSEKYRPEIAWRT